MFSKYIALCLVVLVAAVQAEDINLSNAVQNSDVLKDRWDNQ